MTEEEDGEEIEAEIVIDAHLHQIGSEVRSLSSFL
jgi:hypothetical protein